MQILSVSHLNSYLREMIDADPILSDVWVEGEIFDFKQASSGHWYFSLKEGEATMAAACWRSNVARIGYRPQNGEAVLAHGRVGFYEASGKLQLYVDMIRPSGVGLLHARFEELKARLGAEGLFDASRKRELPGLPRRIGVATSPTGSVIRDIENVLRRRYPLAQLVLAPCKVQGEGAADSVVEALYALYDQAVDVIIVARGGGSAEDLWCFNEEVVARAVYASPVPVISGVGHETDVTIIDYVADLRAPTPSAAAELVAPEIDALAAASEDMRLRMEQALRDQIRQARDEVAGVRRRMESASPLARVMRDRQTIDNLQRRIAASLGHRISLGRARVDGLRAHLTALSPQATLDRGYAVVRRLSDGAVVTDPAQVSPGEPLEITVRHGTFGASSDSQA